MRGVWVLTDRRQARRPLADVVAAAVDGGARVVVLRERDLPRAARAALAVRLRAVLRPAGARLVVSGADPLGGDAVHLPASAGPPPADAVLVGRSCHDAAELAAARSTAHYVTLSPVYATDSKPGYGPALGPQRLAALVAAAGLPVVALGGVTTAARAAACLAAGVTGVAAMGAVMRAADPGAAVAALARAFQEGVA
ncbi:MAG TPA: thiamine phosphate synthase [Pilimelia sp.]|nr:thiamine phosphate synthase [Pilimelia sp.]